VPSVQLSRGPGASLLAPLICGGQSHPDQHPDGVGAGSMARLPAAPFIDLLSPLRLKSKTDDWSLPNASLATSSLRKNNRVSQFHDAIEIRGSRICSSQAEFLRDLVGEYGRDATANPVCPCAAHNYLRLVSSSESNVTTGLMTCRSDRIGHDPPLVAHRADVRYCLGPASEPL
jgi:hypothetical protein